MLSSAVYRANHPDRSREASKRNYYRRKAAGKLAHFNDDGTHKLTGIKPSRPIPTKCEICAQPPRGKRGLCLDHNHETGAFRGWLCGNCNRAIGLLKDDPAVLATAISYLLRG